jgi:hypothetical protein
VYRSNRKTRFLELFDRTYLYGVFVTRPKPTSVDVYYKRCRLSIIGRSQPDVEHLAFVRAVAKVGVSGSWFLVLAFLDKFLGPRMI